MALTENEFFEKEYNDRSAHLQERFSGWTIEQHLEALIIPMKAYDRTYHQWTPPELEYKLGEEIAAHTDALKMLHDFKSDVGKAVNDLYSNQSLEKQQEFDKAINLVHDWYPSDYWRDYQEIELDKDDR